MQPQHYNKDGNKMRTVRTKVYKFSELSEQAKKKAIESLYDLNVCYDWWDGTIEDFIMFCETIGLEVDKNKIYFSGFSSQGDGAAFTADINLKEFIEGINNKKYLEYAPKTKEETGFEPVKCTVDPRILSLIYREWIDINLDIEAQDRPYRTVLSYSSDYTYNQCKNYNCIDKELEKLESWIEEVINDLTDHLYRLLEREHDYLTSEQPIIESIEANEYEFQKDGTKF